MKNEATYWSALAHLPGWGYNKINNLVVRFFHEEKVSIEEFFNLPESEWSKKYELGQKEIIDLKKARSELPALAFLVENLQSQGYELIPITSSEYSKVLKRNLKTSHSPTLLYVKGNKQIFNEKSIAIVGSRSASEISLKFTDNIAKLACQGSRVVVSGFAKGVDKQALDSTLAYKGQSIIVLPQGITTFNSGFKTYYKQIVGGDVLVLSTFPPKAVWSVGLAMARNPIIYGLADDIYVAESSETGGTWSGVIDGLNKGRTIFVRSPEPNEKNANTLLIRKGALSVDFDGRTYNHSLNSQVQNVQFTVKEADVPYSAAPADNFEELILSSFNGKPLSVKDILDKTKLDWTSKKLATYLRKMEAVQTTKKGRANQYILKKTLPEQSDLFSKNNM
jgi:predicted Rossmann fold nucleotide-binding protein DprA/Smf involved in DNA uptake